MATRQCSYGKMHGLNLSPFNHQLKHLVKGFFERFLLSIEIGSGCGLIANTGNEGVHKSEIINFPQDTVWFSTIFMKNMQQ